MGGGRVSPRRVSIALATLATAPVLGFAVECRAAPPTSEPEGEALEAESAPPTAPGAKATPAPERDTAKAACIASFKRAQRLRSKSQLLSARAELVACGQPACPDVIATKCVEWIEDVRRAIPTIVVAAVDGNGHDIATAEVAVDDDVLATSLDGLPVELDPGPHELRVTFEGRTVTNRFVALQGAKNRGIQVRFAPPLPAPSTNADVAKPSLPLLGWVGFGLGASGVVVGTVTGVSAILQAKKLDCPNDVCFEFQEDTLVTGRALAHTSTASFAVAGVGTLLGIASLTWLRPSPTTDVAVAAQPFVAPNGVGLRGTFW